jgi:hypothetical protein
MASKRSNAAGTKRDRGGVRLDTNFDRLGKESTVDIRAKYL